MLFSFRERTNIELRGGAPDVLAGATTQKFSMHTPQSVLGPKLWSRMRRIYCEWVRHDEYGESIYAPSERRPQQSLMSARQFIGPVMAHGSRHGYWLRSRRVEAGMDTPVVDLLSMRLARTGTTGPVAELFIQALCLAQLQQLLSAALDFGFEEESEKSLLINGAGCVTYDELSGRLRTNQGALPVAQALADLLRQELGALKVRELFLAPVNKHGYRFWVPAHFSGEGVALKDTVVALPECSVRMQVSRYTEDVGSNVRPFEWQAQLRVDPNSDEPDAVAYGMVYILAREGEVLLSTASDLRWAADSVADSDVEQVLAFLGQHSDARELMDAGDLCFVWGWERRSGTGKGLGAEVLGTALKALKKRFRRLHTLVVDVSPAQFRPQASPLEPAEIQVERLEAFERVERLLEELAPQKAFDGQLRQVASRRMTFHETVAELAAADLMDD